jgi:hypothetical protein
MKDVKNQKSGKQKRNDIRNKNRNKNKKRNKRNNPGDIFIPEFSDKIFFQFDIPDIDLLNVLDFNLEEDLNLPPLLDSLSFDLELPDFRLPE